MAISPLGFLVIAHDGLPILDKDLSFLNTSLVTPGEVSLMNLVLKSDDARANLLLTSREVIIRNVWTDFRPTECSCT